MSQFVVRLNSDTSYEYFYSEILVKNKVCIFNSSLTDRWRSRSEWVTPEGKPDLNKLCQLFGETEVPVSDCNTKYYNSNPKCQMSFREFIDYWRNVQNIDYEYDKHDMKVLYLKDWHFVKQFPEYIAYETPVYFESDWINEYYTKKPELEDDYRFVYMGPKQSWTPLHTDVFGSYSWSANVCGTKKWLIIPEGNDDNIKAINNNQMPHDFYELPDFEIKLKQLNGFEVIQKSGEIIFIPSGYIHQVINTEDTISINHNWFNGTNIITIFSNCFAALKEVENQLLDLKTLIDDNEWRNECQKLLKLHFGLNVEDLTECLFVVSQRVKNELNYNSVINERSFRVTSDRKYLVRVLEYIKTNHLFRSFNNDKLKLIEDYFK